MRADGGRAKRRGAFALSLASLAACGKEAPRTERAAPSTAPPAPTRSAANVSASLAPSAGPRPTASSTAAPRARPGDAGANACRLLYGPVPQPFAGAVTLASTDSGVVLVAHRDGVPIITRLPGGDAATPAPTDAPPERVSGLPCTVAGRAVFCPDRTGAIHRRPVDRQGEDAVVAHARAGATFAAEVVAGVHTVVVYLTERRTSEGFVSEAYAALDDATPVRVSDEGSGATDVALAPRGAGVVALMLDGRAAMTPLHARTLSVVGGKLQMGEDAVVFVGGGAESTTRGTLGAAASGAVFGLVPIAGESGFGLASVRIDDPPRLDEPSTWSSYPNGLDPAPIAATRGVDPIRVARVRPLEARPDSPRGLELGKLDDVGAFVSYGFVPTTGRVSGASLAVDGKGALWLAFTDSVGSWLERRSCP